MSFTHGWLFFFHSTPTSSPSFAFFSLPVLPSLLSILPHTVPLPRFHFLFKWLLPHCFVCFIREGQVAQGSYYSLALWRMEWAGASRVNGEQGSRRVKRMLSDMSKTPVQFIWWCRRGTSQAKCTKIGSLVFLDGYILSTTRPAENNGEGRWGVGGMFGRDVCPFKVPFVFGVLLEIW